LVRKVAAAIEPEAMFSSYHIAFHILEIEYCTALLTCIAFHIYALSFSVFWAL
jgi:hypothetical protein